MSTFELYLLLLLPELRAFLFAVGCFGGGGMLIAGLANRISAGDYDANSDTAARLRGQSDWCLKWIPWAVVVVGLATLLPSMRTMLILMGWHLGSGVDGLSELPADVIAYLRALLEQEIGELTTTASETPSGGD